MAGRKSPAVPHEDNPFLSASDVQDLTAAVRGLTTAIRDVEREHQRRLQLLGEQDVVSQMLAALHAISAGQDRLFAALTARIGNGQDHAQETDHG